MWEQHQEALGHQNGQKLCKFLLPHLRQKPAAQGIGDQQAHGIEGEIDHAAEHQHRQRKIRYGGHIGIPLQQHQIHGQFQQHHQDEIQHQICHRLDPGDLTKAHGQDQQPKQGSETSHHLRHGQLVAKEPLQQQGANGQQCRKQP